MMDGQLITGQRPLQPLEILPYTNHYRTNCHGYTFGGGRFIIPDESINNWLEGQNMFHPLASSDAPNEGDLVIWRRECKK
jgi:hypothetical protein